MTSDARALSSPVRRPKSALPAPLSHGAIFVVALPFLFSWMLSSALRGNDEVFTSLPQLLSSHVQWDHFVHAWVFLPFGGSFAISCFVSAAVTLIVLLASSLAASAFARQCHSFGGR